MSMNFYIHQRGVCGLGNFVNTTPTIIRLFEHFEKRVPVYFDTVAIKELYKDWDHILVLDKPAGNMLCDTCQYMNHEEREYITRCVSVLKKLNIPGKRIPHTFVPVDALQSVVDGRYVVVIKGCNKDSIWQDKKNVSNQVYDTILTRVGHKKIFVGNSHDYQLWLKHFRYLIDAEFVLDDIKRAVALISGCEFVISNDTGLYHVAGALGKRIFVMWKDTPFIKNKSPGVRCFFSHKDNWVNDFERFLKSNIKL